MESKLHCVSSHYCHLYNCALTVSLSASQCSAHASWHTATEQRLARLKGLNTYSRHFLPQGPETFPRAEKENRSLVCCSETNLPRASNNMTTRAGFIALLLLIAHALNRKTAELKAKKRKDQNCPRVDVSIVQKRCGRGYLAPYPNARPWPLLFIQSKWPSLQRVCWWL